MSCSTSPLFINIISSLNPKKSYEKIIKNLHSTRRTQRQILQVLKESEDLQHPTKNTMVDFHGPKSLQDIMSEIITIWDNLHFAFRLQFKEVELKKQREFQEQMETRLPNFPDVLTTVGRIDMGVTYVQTINIDTVQALLNPIKENKLFVNICAVLQDSIDQAQAGIEDAARYLRHLSTSRLIEQEADDFVMGVRKEMLCNEYFIISDRECKQGQINEMETLLQQVENSNVDKLYVESRVRILHWSIGNTNRLPDFRTLTKNVSASCIEAVNAIETPVFNEAFILAQLQNINVHSQYEGRPVVCIITAHGLNDVNIVSINSDNEFVNIGTIIKQLTHEKREQLVICVNSCRCDGPTNRSTERISFNKEKVIILTNTHRLQTSGVSHSETDKKFTRIILKCLRTPGIIHVDLIHRLQMAVIILSTLRIIDKDPAFRELFLPQLNKWIETESTGTTDSPNLNKGEKTHNDMINALFKELVLVIKEDDPGSIESIKSLRETECNEKKLLEMDNNNTDLARLFGRCIVKVRLQRHSKFYDLITDWKRNTSICESLPQIYASDSASDQMNLRLTMFLHIVTCTLDIDLRKALPLKRVASFSR